MERMIERTVCRAFRVLLYIRGDALLTCFQS